MPPPSTSGFIPAHGNYRELLSYQKAEVIYDLTYRFCQRFLVRSDRTIGQMVQAVRSGKQNILEGSKASGTSKEMGPPLTFPATPPLPRNGRTENDRPRTGRDRSSPPRP